jgi:hypothetical protein
VMMGCDRGVYGAINRIYWRQSPEDTHHEPRHSGIFMSPL